MREETLPDRVGEGNLSGPSRDPVGSKGFSSAAYVKVVLGESWDSLVGVPPKSFRSSACGACAFIIELVTVRILVVIVTMSVAMTRTSKGLDTDQDRDWTTTESAKPAKHQKTRTKEQGLIDKDVKTSG